MAFQAPLFAAVASTPPAAAALEVVHMLLTPERAGAERVAQDIESVYDLPWTEVARQVSTWSGAPVDAVSSDELARLAKFEEVLHQRVIGQEEGVAAIAEAVKRSRAGLQNPNGPIASFILCGPTGVGQTELCGELAAAYYGREDAMIRLDMSEFTEPLTSCKLLGYLGCGEEGQLGDGMLREPCGLVLFDGVEKAPPDFFDLMLQILEDGRLTDSEGRLVSFKSAMIVMTSNAGAKQIEKQLLGDEVDFSAGGDPEEAETSQYQRLKVTVRLDALTAASAAATATATVEILLFAPDPAQEAEEARDDEIVSGSSSGSQVEILLFAPDPAQEAEEARDDEMVLPGAPSSGAASTAGPAEPGAGLGHGGAPFSGATPAALTTPERRRRRQTRLTLCPQMQRLAAAAEGWLDSPPPPPPRVSGLRSHDFAWPMSWTEDSRVLGSPPALEARRLFAADSPLSPLQDQLMPQDEGTEGLGAFWRRSDEEEEASTLTGAPVDTASSNELGRLAQLEEVLRQRVIGQEEAVVAIAEAVRRPHAGLQNPNRPIASFIFCGPTGVGQTELCKALAAAYYGREDAMIHLDMSGCTDPTNPFTLSELLDYLGCGEEGQLADGMLREPCGLVLFDGVEQAHPVLFDLMLQIVEDSQLADSEGNPVSFKNTMIVMTSNAGAQQIEQQLLGGEVGFSAGGDPEEAETSEYQRLSPELLDRLGEVIVFRQPEVGAISEPWFEEACDLNENEAATESTTDSDHRSAASDPSLAEALQTEVQILRAALVETEAFLEASEEKRRVLEIRLGLREEPREEAEERAQAVADHKAEESKTAEAQQQALDSEPAKSATAWQQAIDDLEAKVTKIDAKQSQAAEGLATVQEALDAQKAEAAKVADAQQKALAEQKAEAANQLEAVQQDLSAHKREAEAHALALKALQADHANAFSVLQKAVDDCRSEAAKAAEEHSEALRARAQTAFVQASRAMPGRRPTGSASRGRSLRFLLLPLTFAVLRGVGALAPMLRCVGGPPLYARPPLVPGAP